jgi:isoleucyl-tRNA synthetase
MSRCAEEVYKGFEIKLMHAQAADKDIQRVLKQRGRLIVQSTIVHQYPFCWRSGTPLLYRAIPVWFVRVQPAIDRLIANNQETRW